jgi:hypothetical protein
MAAVRLVTGDASELRRLAEQLRRAGQEQRLANGVMSAIVSTAHPLRAEASKHALAILPKRGGLAAEVAQQPMPISYSQSKSRGVRLKIDVRPGRGKAGIGDPAAVNRGRLRHPVFGHADRWVTKTVAAGWFSVPMQQGAAKVKAAIIEALRRELAKLQ